MKLRYFLRGLGIGVFVTAMILMISHQTQSKPQSLTDEQIIERAELLGMVVPEKTQSPVPEESTEQDSSPQTSSTPEPSEEPSPDVSSSPDVSPSPDVSSSPEASPSPSPKASPSAKPKPDASEEPEAQETEYVSFHIEKGMWSEEVSRALQEEGLVKSAGEFNRYLTDNGYASHISVGTYRIAKGATHGEIARAITKN